ncbi:MAG: glycosyltransferase family 39 protein [Thermodesulfobacteriota bacterium]
MVPLALLALVALRVGLQLVLHESGFRSLTADEFARVVVAARWAETGEPIGPGPWPPLQFYVLGTALQLHWDLLVTPRVVSSVVGLAAIGLVWAIGTRLGGRAAGLLAAFGLAIQPSHVWLSSTPLSEGFYATWWLAAVLATMRFHAGRRPAWLLLAAAAVAAASATRLEGWVVAVLFCAYCARQIGLAEDSRRRAAYAAALLLAAAFPVLWVLSDFVAHGSAFSFLRDIESYKAAFEKRGSAQPAGPWIWLEVARTIDPFLLPAALVGAVTLARRRSPELAPYALLACAPLPIFLVLHAGHLDPWVNHVRYLSPFLWLLLALAGCGAAAVLRALAPQARRRAALLAIGLAVVGAWQARQTLSVRNDPSVAGIAAGRELARLRGASDADVLVEVGYYDYLAIHAGAGDVRRIVYDRTLDHARLAAMYDALHAGWPEAWGGACGGLPAARLEGEWLARCLRARDVAFVVAHTAQTRVRLERQLGLVPVREIGGYAIYEVPRKLRASPVVAVR